MRLRARYLGGGVLLTAALLALLAGCNNTSSTSGGGSGGTNAGGGSPKGNVITGDTILIGSYVSSTGEDAEFGIQSQAGIELAVDEINSAGGINGKKIELKTENDESDAVKARNAAEKLVTSDKVVAVVGEIASGRSLAAAPVCQKYGVPMVTPGSTNVKVTQAGDHIFRVCFIDPFQAYVIAKFAHDTLHAKTAATFAQSGNPYSLDFALEFKKNFTKLGGSIVQEATFGATDTDFKGALTKIQQSNPDVLLIPAYYNKVGAIGKQAQELGIKAPMLGGDGWGLPGIFQTAGSAMEGGYFSDHAAFDNPNPGIQKFVAAFTKKFPKEVPGSMTALGYDAMMILANAIKNAKTPDGQGIRDALAATKDFQGATGTITINADRNAEKPAVIKQIKGREFKFVESIDPPKAQTP